MNCYLPPPSVMSLTADHTLWADAHTFNRFKTPPSHVAALCLLVIHLFSSKCSQAVHVQLLLCTSSVCCAPPHAPWFPSVLLTLTDRQGWQVEICHPPQMKRKEIRFSTCNFKHFCSYLSRKEYYFLPDVQRDPWHNFCVCNKRRSQTFSHKMWSFSHYISTLGHLYL